MSEKYTFVVFSNAFDGQDAEYNEWYEHTHLDDVIQVHGIVSAQRFRLADTQLLGEGADRSVKMDGEGSKDCPWRYMVLYEFETASALETFKDMQQRVESGVMTVEPVIELTTLTAYLYQPAGPKHAR